MLCDYITVYYSNSGLLLVIKITVIDDMVLGRSSVYSIYNKHIPF